MKKEKLIQQLTKDGHKVKYGKFENWDNIPYIQHKNGTFLFLTCKVYTNNMVSITYDEKKITYNFVINMLIHTGESYLMDIIHDPTTGHNHYNYLS